MSSRAGVMYDATLIVNGKDLSDHTKSLKLNLSQAELPSNAFGDDYATKEPGLKDWSFTAQLYQDYAASSVNATLWPIFKNRLKVPAVFQPNPGTISASCPAYSGLVFISSYPIGGEHGTMQMVDVNFSAAGDITQLET